ncbi:hypothetical protein L1887_61397 [Cichorium endivia]|nr:hypothetical protein L1887_61397 [Cichorium endivia]
MHRIRAPSTSHDQQPRSRDRSTRAIPESAVRRNRFGQAKKAIDRKKANHRPLECELRVLDRGLASVGGDGADVGPHSQLPLTLVVAPAHAHCHSELARQWRGLNRTTAGERLRGPVGMTSEQIRGGALRLGFAAMRCICLSEKANFQQRGFV